MKARKPITVAALALAATIAVPATASISTGNLALDVRSAVGSDGNVNVSLVDGVATLSGHANDVSAKAKARRAALANADVERVIDLIRD